jgi:hypothetical protein
MTRSANARTTRPAACAAQNMMLTLVGRRGGLQVDDRRDHARPRAVPHARAACRARVRGGSVLVRPPGERWSNSSGGRLSKVLGAYRVRHQWRCGCHARVDHDDARSWLRRNDRLNLNALVRASAHAGRHVLRCGFGTPAPRCWCARTPILQVLRDLERFMQSTGARRRRACSSTSTRAPTTCRPTCARC